MRAILYARVSTRGQAERGYSLRQQMEALRDHVSKNGWEVLAEISDDGRSGMTLDRPGMDRVRELVEVGGVGVVLAQDGDRIAREPALHYLLETEFAKHGTNLQAITDWGDDSPEGQLLKGIRQQVSKYERVLITERTRRGKLRRAKEGKVVPAGTPPIGFTYSDGAYQLDEPTMSVVRRIFNLAAEGTSLHRIRRILESEGLTTPSTPRKPGGSKFWNTNTLRRIIGRDEYRPYTFEEIKGLVADSVSARLDPEKS